MRGILGKKIGMTQVYGPDGRLIPVTVLAAGPCRVVQHKTPENDGYRAVQLGFQPQKPARVTQPLRGHFARAGVEPCLVLGEMSVETDELPPVGSEVTVKIFESGERVDVTARSKGKGLQGVVKRHGFSGGPKTHGSMTWRRPGSIGASADPARVWRGMRMAGRTGYRMVTAQNLTVVEVRAADHLLLVCGAVPGPNGGFVEIRKAVKG